MDLEQKPSERVFPVRFSDCDPSSRLRISAFFDFMEETAILDAEENGFGIRKMVATGYTYVISRIKLRINHTPLWGERLLVSTWTKSFYAHKAVLRDYSILDERKNIIAEATSSWLLVNLSTGRSEDPETGPFFLPLYPERVALDENLELLPPRENPRTVLSRKACYSDLDLNLHVNNCRYADWVFDALYQDPAMRKADIRSIQMNYLAGIGLGTEVNLVRYGNSNHHAYISGVNAVDPSKVHFQARIGISG